MVIPAELRNIFHMIKVLDLLAWVIMVMPENKLSLLWVMITKR